MERITRSYIEKIYKGFLFSESVIEEVNERNPLLIKNDGYMQGFRFFDKTFIIDGDNEYEGKNINYSDWIYFGKRYSYDEIVKTYGYDSNYKVLIGNMKNNNYKYVCKTQVNSFLPMEEGDVTFEEYFFEMSKPKTMKKQFKNS